MTFGSRLLIGSLLTLLAVPLSAAAAIWQEVAPQGQIGEPSSRYYHADEAALRARLALAPHEVLLDDSLVVELPMPDGERQRFVVVESPIMAPELAARFPQVKTFKLRGVDDPAASGRADITAQGFHAMLHTSRGVVLIDPAAGTGQPGVYRSLNRRGLAAPGFACGAHSLETGPIAGVMPPSPPASRIEGNFQTYRLAVSATSEYVAAVTNATSAITTAINRVNQIYERDLGIRFQLVANDGRLIESADDECFTNNDRFAMIGENQVWIDERIGESAYDIGHVFSTVSGGLAFIGTACRSGFKAQAVSGLPNPINDPFYIDIVAHEIGHQMNANHSFNGTTGSCSGNRVGAAAFEPGSGSTIMGYSGICIDENLQFPTDATFHAGSISAINQYTAGAGSCFVTVNNGNTDPMLTLLSDRTIPANTPFRLVAIATDTETPAALTYQWDQLDSGDATTAVTFGTDLGNNPLFRTYEPQAAPYRDFPALGTQVLGQTDKAEVLPTTNRPIDFRVTVRDGDSGQATSDFTLDVVTSSGFRVTSQAADQTILASAGPFTVTWDPAGTIAGSSVNCTDVSIDLIAFDDAAYTNHTIHTLVASTPNDGNHSVPATADSLLNPSRGRLRVKCVGNVFYALSEGDLQFVGSDLTPTFFDDDDFPTFFNANGLTVSRPAPAATLPAFTSTAPGLVDVFAAAPPPLGALVDECGFDPASNLRDSTALDPRLAGLLLLLAGIRLARRYGWH